MNDQRTSAHAGRASNGARRSCSLCGFTALNKALFVKVAGRYVCRDISRCKGQQVTNGS